MNTNDRNAEYLAGGTPGESSDAEALESVRSVLTESETWATPPEGLRSGVLDAIAAEASAQSDGGTSRNWSWIGAAAAVILIAFSLVALWPTGTRVVLGGTDLAPQASGVAVLEATGAGWAIEVDLTDLPPAEPGFYYEGWVWNERGEGVSIGTFHLRGANKPVTLWAGVDVNEYPMIWISLQEEGAGNEVSDEIVMKGQLEGSPDA